MKIVIQKLYLSLGLAALLAGVAGIFLPLLPTTPFVILAAFFFSKSSPRLHQWLLHHPHMGPYLLEWEKHRVIRLRAKVVATLTVIVSLTYPIGFMDIPFHAKVIVCVSVFVVFTYIWTRASHPPRSPH